MLILNKKLNKNTLNVTYKEKSIQLLKQSSESRSLNHKIKHKNIWNTRLNKI